MNVTLSTNFHSQTYSSWQKTDILSITSVEATLKIKVDGTYDKLVLVTFMNDKVNVPPNYLNGLKMMHVLLVATLLEQG